MKLTDTIKQLKEIFKRDGESDISVLVMRGQEVLIDDPIGLDVVSIGDAVRMLGQAHKLSGAVGMDITISEATQPPAETETPPAQGKRRRGNGDDTRKSRN